MEEGKAMIIFCAIMRCSILHSYCRYDSKVRWTFFVLIDKTLGCNGLRYFIIKLDAYTCH